MKPMKSKDGTDFKSEKMKNYVARKKADKEAKILQHNLQNLEFSVGDIGDDDVGAGTGSNEVI